MANRIAILKARAAQRKNPLSRQVLGTVKRVEPVPCPIGKCDHLAGVHDLVKVGTDDHGWPLAGARCTADGCDCEGPTG